MNRRNFMKNAIKATAGLIYAASPLEAIAQEVEKINASKRKIVNPETYTVKTPEDLRNLPTKHALARLGYGEGRSCAPEEELAILFTALNRNKDGLLFNGEKDIFDVILKDKQYSCFNWYQNGNNENYIQTLNPQKHDKKAWKRSLNIAEIAIIKDINKLETSIDKGQTFYHRKDIAELPKWAKDPKYQKVLKEPHFKHDFYNYLKA